MNVFLWVLQGLLAAAFLFAGLNKVFRGREQLMKSGMAYVEDLSDNTVKLIGGAEVLGALGLILPAATGIAPILTPLAATGLAIVMIGAIITHVRRKEVPMGVIAPGVLLILAVVVAWGRFGPYSF